MLHIKEAIVVEGKFDKERLRKITDAPIVCTHGFDVYRSKQLISVIRKLAETRGIIILTDSDRAGFRIRGYLKQCIGNDTKIKHAYIPEIKGKEKRKEAPGKDGLLGVEGMDENVLLRVLKSVTEVEEREGSGREITKADFYSAGLSGGEGSVERRQRLARYFDLPQRISANALLEMLCQVYSKAEFEAAVEHLFAEKGKKQQNT